MGTVLARAPLLLGLLLAACDGPTTILLSIDSDGAEVARLSASIAVGGTTRTRVIPDGGGVPRLPGTVLIIVPDEAAPVAIALDASDASGRALHEEAMIESVPHHQVDLRMVLQAGGRDLGPAGELAGSDAGAQDLAGRDLAGADLAPSPITKVQVGPVAQSSLATVSLTLAKPSTPGTTLVATLAGDDGSATIVPPPGWLRAAGAGVNNTLAEIWFYPANPGLIGAVNFAASNGNALAGQLSEWAAPGLLTLEQRGTATVNTSATSVSVSTAGPASLASELAITAFCQHTGASVNIVYTAGMGWTGLGNNGTTPSSNHYAADYRLLDQTGVVSETENSNLSTLWSAAIATFRY